jgi:hypothetical protein
LFIFVFLSYTCNKCEKWAISLSLTSSVFSVSSSSLVSAFF